MTYVNMLNLYHIIHIQKYISHEIVAIYLEIISLPVPSLDVAVMLDQHDLPTSTAGDHCHCHRVAE